MADQRVPQQVGRAPRHSGAEVQTHGAKYDDDSGRHVLAAVLSQSFGHSQSAAVSNGKALTSSARHVKFARSSTVENRIPASTSPRRAASFPAEMAMLPPLR